MSYDINIWSGRKVKDFSRSQIDFEECLEVELEDIPKHIVNEISGIKYLTEIHVYDYNFNDKALKLALKLAKKYCGIVEDVQQDKIFLTNGEVKTFVYEEGDSENDSDDKSNDDTNDEFNDMLGDNRGIALIWYIDDCDFLSSNKLDNFIDTVERILPFAMPYRYGDYEPVKYKYVDKGKEHFIDFLKNSDFPILLQKKPFLGMDIRVPKTRYKTRLFENDTNFSNAKNCFLSTMISIEIERSSFFDINFNKRLEELFVEVSKIVKPYFAHVCEIDDYRYSVKKKEEKGEIVSWWWRGIPKNLGYAVVLGKPYVNMWDEFVKNSIKLDDELFVVSNFGDSEFNSILNKVGSISTKITAPNIHLQLAEDFPF